MIYVKAQAKKRGKDQQGAGHYGAPRGNRKHRGIDYACEPGSLVFSPIAGLVTKLGYPYSHDLSFRYVEISDSNGIRHRVFYVYPTVIVGDFVTKSDTIGASQKLPYEGITQHCHYEVKDKEGNYLNPEGK